MHFHENLNFKQNFTWIYSLGSNWQHGSISSDNDLALIRRQAIIWSNDVSLLTYLCVTACLPDVASFQLQKPRLFSPLSNKYPRRAALLFKTAKNSFGSGALKWLCISYFLMDLILVCCFIQLPWGQALSIGSCKSALLLCQGIGQVQKKLVLNADMNECLTL